MAIYLEHLGGFLRWLIKGAKTNIKDELNSRTQPFLLKNCDDENWLLGFILNALLLFFIVWFFTDKLK